MKVSTEVWLVIAAVAFLLSYLIDRIAGPVNISVGNPIAFLSSTTLLSRYPFTAAAIAIRTIAIFISAMLIITSVTERKYFTKAMILLFVGILAEFYAIQQLATGFKLTSIQWTLSIAYGSLLLTLGVIAMVLKGIWASFNQKEEGASQSTGPDDESGQDRSILEP
jgi:hypothetical protein